jgi:glycosyltransferase involved in cell wall biosynthesis
VLPAGGDGNPSGFSFIIPTIGRAESLVHVLGQIEAIVCEPHEIVLALDGCDTATQAHVQRVAEELVRASFTVVRLDTRSGASAARNRAVRAASRPACVFLDDDVTIDEEWWRAARAELARGAECLTGPVLTRETSLLAGARAQRYLSRYDGLRTGDRVGFLAGGNAIILRQHLESVGLFPEAVIAGDSLVVDRLAHAGVPCVFVREMAIYHQHDRGLAGATLNAFKAGRVIGSIEGLTAELRSLARQVHRPRDFAPFGLNCALLLVKLAGTMTAPRGRR